MTSTVASAQTTGAMSAGPAVEGNTAAPQATQPGVPQMGPQMGPQVSYPSEARSDTYNRSTYTPPAYTPPTGPAGPTATPAQSVYSQPTVPWVGQAPGRYLPAVGGAVQAGVRR